MLRSVEKGKMKSTLLNILVSICDMFNVVSRNLKKDEDGKKSLRISDDKNDGYFGKIFETLEASSHSCSNSQAQMARHFKDFMNFMDGLKPGRVLFFSDSLSLSTLTAGMAKNTNFDSPLNQALSMAVHEFAGCIYSDSAAFSLPDDACGPTIWIPRECNVHADSRANWGMDNQISVNFISSSTFRLCPAENSVLCMTDGGLRQSEGKASAAWVIFVYSLEHRDWTIYAGGVRFFQDWVQSAMEAETIGLHDGLMAIVGMIRHQKLTRQVLPCPLEFLKKLSDLPSIVNSNLLLS